jgi:hypothetical protein
MRIKSLTVIILALIISSIGLSGCLSLVCEKGSGNISEEYRQVADFNTIILEGTGDVYVMNSDKETVKVETDDNLQQLVISEISDKKLYVGSRKTICPNKLNIYITIKDIKGVLVRGAGDIKIKGPFETNELKLKIEGSGSIYIKDMIAKLLKSAILGSGDIKISGRVDDAMIDITGSGNIDFLNLEALSTMIEISGSGDAKVNVKEKLMIKVDGSGDVMYIGEPPLIRTKINGSGDVRKLK